MAKTFFAIIGILALVGCDRSTDTIVCGDYTVQMQPGTDVEVLDIVINDDAVTLMHAVSASGARYVGNLNDTVVELWNKGRDWTLTLNDEEPISCK